MNLIKVFLTKLKTRDGVTLDGIYVKPRRRGNTALIWIHGLTSYFYSSQTLVKELSSLSSRNRIGYFKFNTRGHDLVVRGQDKHVLLGTLFEKFEDCTLDIRATILFAKRLGYRNIILAGHSTGANKIVYYMYRTRDHGIKGVALVAGLNDIVAETKRVGKKEFVKTLGLAQRLNRKDPSALFMSKGFLFTASRYLSLHKHGTTEDVFPYHSPGAHWGEFKNIRTPLAVILGSRDEYLDRPAKKLIEIFKQKAQSTKSFSGATIKGANHGFYKKEKELAKVVINWIKRVNRYGA